MPADEIVHHLPMRWADLDSLNHVNNVVYLAYAAESRGQLADDGIVPGDDRVRAISVRFLRPLLLTREPVVVVSIVEDDTLTQQICLEKGDDRTVFARVVTTFGEHEAAAPSVGVGTHQTQVRRSDLDADGFVRLPQVFELFQEARVLTISQQLTRPSPGSFVVGSSEVTYRAPMAWRSEPYAAGVWVGRVGRASFEIRAELSDGGRVLADSTTVLVGFDLTTQTSRPFGEHERAQLTALIQA